VLRLRLDGLEQQNSVLMGQIIEIKRHDEWQTERLNLALEERAALKARMDAAEADLHELHGKVDYRQYHAAAGLAFGPGGPRLAADMRMDHLKVTYFPAKGLQVMAAPLVYLGNRVVWQPFGLGFMVYQSRSDAFSSRWLRQSFAFAAETAIEIDLLELPAIVRLGLRASLSVYVPNPFDVGKPVYNDVNADVQTATDAVNGFKSIAKKLAMRQVPPGDLGDLSLDELRTLERDDPARLNGYTPDEIYLLDHETVSHANDHTKSAAQALVGPLKEPTLLISVIARFP
jgi:hypothetical protein